MRFFFLLVFVAKILTRGPMIPGEYFLSDEPIEINEGRPTRRLEVTNRGDRPVQVGSHCHFLEANRCWRSIARRPTACV